MAQASVALAKESETGCRVAKLPSCRVVSVARHPQPDYRLLPEVETLRDVKLQTPMRVYTREGDLIGQFGEQKRSPLVFEDIPDQFVKALLAAKCRKIFVRRGNICHPLN